MTPFWIRNFITLSVDNNNPRTSRSIRVVGKLRETTLALLLVFFFILSFFDETLEL